VTVDDAPTSPNQKEANWMVISTLLPVFKDQLMAQPEVLAMVLEYSPLPSQLVSRHQADYPAAQSRSAEAARAAAGQGIDGCAAAVGGEQERLHRQHEQRQGRHEAGDGGL
jgi:hypothetical protein